MTKIKHADAFEKVNTVTIDAEDVVINNSREITSPDAGAKTDEYMEVASGRNIFTGETLMKQVSVPKTPKDWSEGRKKFPVHKAITGSLNNRKFDLKVGDDVYLNADELSIFRLYVAGAGK